MAGATLDSKLAHCTCDSTTVQLIITLNGRRLILDAKNQQFPSDLLLGLSCSLGCCLALAQGGLGLQAVHAGWHLLSLPQLWRLQAPRH